MTETKQPSEESNSFVNLELKHFCPDFAPIRQILTDIEAERVGVFHQEDSFLNLPLTRSKVPRRLKLRVQDGTYTLVYYERPEFSRTQSTPANVSLYHVEDKTLAEFLIQALGVKALVEKDRELWRKDNVIFNLDNVKGVGQIFEIELKVRPGNVEAQKKEFATLRKLFEPFLGEIAKGSNLDLTINRS